MVFTSTSACSDFVGARAWHTVR